MSIIGEFGQVELISKAIKQTLVVLTVNLEHKHCQFGKPLYRLCPINLAMIMEPFYCMKDIIVDLALLSTICNYI